MARYTGPVCKLCRREGTKLFLKGQRCFSQKCAIETRNYAPGEHGRERKRKVSTYGTQLREKQKIRRVYGMLERQFRIYYQRADRAKGVTGEVIMQQLELRLDNIVYRMGFAPSRAAARQLVLHGHFSVNDRTVNVPSFQTRAGDTVRVRDKSRNLKVITESLEARRGSDLDWFVTNEKAMEGRIIQVPRRDQIPAALQEQLVVELYSK
jgi:small subunit ribosomal protein S4